MLSPVSCCFAWHAKRSLTAASLLQPLKVIGI
jgi:hypothetical protein